MKNLSMFSLVSLMILISVPAYPKSKKKHQVVQCKSAIEVKNVGKLGPRRNLVILQDDINEVNGMLGACTLTLLRALQAESAPILVSSGLWFNMCLYLHAHGNEHSLKPHKKNWQLYRVTSDVYCAIPKKYKEKIQFVCKDFPAQQTIADGTQLTRDDITLGIKCSRLSAIESPFLISWSRVFGNRLRLLGSAFSYHAALSPAVLRKVLVSSEDIANIKEYPPLDIFMVGHGRASSLFSSVIAGYSIPEFHAIIVSFEHDFHLNVLIYQTCYGGDLHLVKPFMTNGKPDVYHYTIISCCTGAMPSVVYFEKESKHSLEVHHDFPRCCRYIIARREFSRAVGAFYPSQMKRQKSECFTIFLRSAGQENRL